MHPQLGQVEPDEFVPLAEMSGEIGAIDNFILAPRVSSSPASDFGTPHWSFRSTCQLMG